MGAYLVQPTIKTALIAFAATSIASGVWAQALPGAMRAWPLDGAPDATASIVTFAGRSIRYILHVQ